MLSALAVTMKDANSTKMARIRITKPPQLACRMWFKRYSCPATRTEIAGTEHPGVHKLGGELVKFCVSPGSLLRRGVGSSEVVRRRNYGRMISPDWRCFSNFAHACA